MREREGESERSAVKGRQRSKIGRELGERATYHPHCSSLHVLVVQPFPIPVVVEVKVRSELREREREAEEGGGNRRDET